MRAIFLGHQKVYHFLSFQVFSYGVWVFLPRKNQNNLKIFFNNAFRQIMHRWMIIIDDVRKKWKSVAKAEHRDFDGGFRIGGVGVCFMIGLLGNQWLP